MQISSGSIPKMVSYIYSVPREVSVGCPWDGAEFDNGELVGGKKTLVYPTFVVDSENKKSLETARTWAQNLYDNKGKSVREESFSNDPIKKIAILSLEMRGNGGRAYKVLIDDKYYVDLREDVMVDAMLANGIQPGGILNGKFIWVKQGANTKLCRVDSELYKMIKEYQDRSSIKTIGKGDLEVGGVYATKRGDQGIFIGYVDTVDGKGVLQKKQMLFCNFNQYEKLNTLAKNIANKNNYYNIDIKKSHSYIEKVNQVDIPENSISKIQKYSMKDWEATFASMEKEAKRYKNGAGGSYYTNRIVGDYDTYHAKKCNMYESGKDPITPFDISKFDKYNK